MPATGQAMVRILSVHPTVLRHEHRVNLTLDQDSRRPDRMSIPHYRFATHRVLRWAAAAGLAAALSLPAWSVSAQTASTDPRCTIQLSVSNPTPGDQEVPTSLIMSGIAFDQTATDEDDNGIAMIQAFLGDRNFGGQIIGTAAFQINGPAGSWIMEATLPDVHGGDNIFVYALSSVTGQEASVAIPVVIQAPAPEGIEPSTQSVVSCPSVLAPTVPIVALGH
jgi:hypothetical protein